MSFDNDPDDLTHPFSVNYLRDRAIPGGRVHVTGRATFLGVRVDVHGVSGRNLVKVVGELPPVRVHGRDFIDPTYRDSRSPLMVGEVSFLDLSEFWLTRTSTFDLIDEGTPLPGLLTTIADTDFGVADAGGTVSLTGVPQLQLIWLGPGMPPREAPAGLEPAGLEPAGSEASVPEETEASAIEPWQRDGYGAFTRLVPRDRVPSLRHVEWTAIWRDITVQVAAIHGDRAQIFVTRGGVPHSGHPEIRHGIHTRSGWSALVDRADLSLRGYTSTERPVGQGLVIGCVGLLRGRTAVLLRPGPRDEPTPGLVAIRQRGETVTEDFYLHARTSSSSSSLEWRAIVPHEAVTQARRVEATTQWHGEVRAVEGLNEPAGVVYVSRTSAPVSEVTALSYTVTPVPVSDLPEVDWQIPDFRGAERQATATTEKAAAEKRQAAADARAAAAGEQQH